MGDSAKTRRGVKRSVKIALYAAVPAAVLAAALAVYRFLPAGMPGGEDYFAPVGQRKLLEDEKGQWSYVRNQFNRLDSTGDTFGDWDPRMQILWKYSIAFSSYGVPSICLADPEHADMAIYTMWTMIRAMKSKKVWEDWLECGFGEDPISRQNIMYKGHLNLMYGLYQLVSGDERFARECTWLTRQIAKEIRSNHATGRYEGVECEPGHYFVQCNSIGLLSLHVYDKLFGTHYTENEVQWTLAFIHRRMTDPETGLYWTQYHPTHDTVERYLSGYTNAWTMVVLRSLEPEYNNRLYPVWKKVFVREIGPYAYVRETPEGGPSKMATTFGLWAAKEFGDVGLFRRLRNSIDKKGGLAWVPETAVLMYKEGDNTLGNGTVLSFKVHAGWNAILSHDWGHKRPATIPDVSGMTWKDVLPQEVHELAHMPPPAM